MYLDKVKGSGLCSEKKEIDAAAKKGILGLIFKKIIIKNASKSAAADCRIAPFWYSPFDKIILEEGSDKKCRHLNKKAMPTGRQAAAISLRPTADAWAIIYHRLKSALEITYHF